MQGTLAKADKAEGWTVAALSRRGRGQVCLEAPCWSLALSDAEGKGDTSCTVCQGSTDPAASSRRSRAEALGSSAPTAREPLAQAASECGIRRSLAGAVRRWLVASHQPKFTVLPCSFPCGISAYNWKEEKVRREKPTAILKRGSTRPLVRPRRQDLHFSNTPRVVPTRLRSDMSDHKALCMLLWWS